MSDAHDSLDQPATTLRRWGRRLGLTLAGGLLWISLLDFPDRVASDHLDTSWARALGYCLTHRLQAGTDYLFTYGPLGYFTTPVYDPDLFWWRYGWEVVVKLLLAATFLRLLLSLPWGWLRVVFYLLILLLFPGRDDLPYVFLIVSLVCVALLAGKPSRWLLGGCAAVLAVLSLTKFTFCLLGWFGLGCLLVSLARQGLWRAIFWTGAVYLGVVLALWFMLGQSPDGLLAYLRGAVEMARGYSEAMTAPGGTTPFWLSLLILLVLAVAGLTMGRPLCRPAVLSGLALVAGLALLEWKHGFVRQFSHQGYYFTTALFIPVVLLAVCSPRPSKDRTMTDREGCRTFRSRLGVGLALTAVVLSLVGEPPVWWKELRNRQGLSSLGPRALESARRRIEGLTVPLRARRRLEEKRAGLAARWDLPRIRSYVGQEPIDLLTHHQGVLFLNRFHWKPRPVFQSYTAYTPALLERNGAFYRSPAAPRFVLLRLSPIDDHFPCLEDGPTLSVLLRRYTPVTREKGFLLLQKQHLSNPWQPTQSPSTDTIRLGEWVSLSPRDRKGCSWASIHLSYSSWGQFRCLVYRAPVVHLGVRTQSGKERTYRLVPSMARCGFLLDPLIVDTDDLLGLYRSSSKEGVPPRGGGERVHAIRLLTDCPECFEPTVTLELRTWRDTRDRQAG
jgi:hypothetical protein